ncbi:MAG: PAS domain-containing sensor histidine kinase [bacterium]
MKTFHKQLIIALIFFVIVFGTSVFFSYRGLHAVLDNFAEQTAKLVVPHLKSTLKSGMSKLTAKNTFTRAQENRIRQQLIQETTQHQIIEDLYLIDGKGQILFSLIPTSEGNPYSEIEILKNGILKNRQEFEMQRLGGAGEFDIIWLSDSKRKIYSVLRLNAKAGKLKPVLHNLQITFYFIGFGGIVAVIVFSLIYSRTLNSPIKQVEKAMSMIDKRKYGFRIKWKEGDEYAPTFKRVNAALQRLEQLDVAQRKAAHSHQTIRNELRTFSRFLDIMSHEIKNPLHALGINIDLLKSKIKKNQSKETMLKNAEILENEIEHMEEVIQGFLSYVRPGKPKRERVPINKIIKDTCQGVSAEAEKSKIRIESRLSRSVQHVLIDKGHLQQALLNIIINAIHATRAGGKINVRSWTKKKKIFVSVKDTGAGISKEQLKKIFDLYYTTKKNGSGLGLPVTKRLIEANGGQMQLESKLEKGTQVTFSFPAA